MAASAECQSLLLALPDPCLLAVLQCCAAGDQRSLLSAARAHSRLHQTAVLALRSITAVVHQQQKVRSVLLYLARHGKQVDCIDLIGDQTSLSVHQLPPNLQLSSLQLEQLLLGLHPGNGIHGVLRGPSDTMALKKLRLSSCDLLSEGLAAPNEDLAAALSLLPTDMEHLSISRLTCGSRSVQFPTALLQQLQQLTYLELADVEIHGPDKASPALQPLQAMTRLVDLRLQCYTWTPINASMLSGIQHLTRIQLCRSSVEPGALAGKTQLQHLELAACHVPGGAAGTAQLLSHLQPLEQLTHLNLTRSVQDVWADTPSASAFAALTASSKLHHLDISCNTLPAGVWHHMFPAGRQLAHLTALNITGALHPSGQYAAAPEGRLLSCCPSLQSLKMMSLQLEGLLRELLGLSGLRTLVVTGGPDNLLQLTQLKQLTSLMFYGGEYLELTCRVSCEVTSGAVCCVTYQLLVVVPCHSACALHIVRHLLPASLARQ